MPLEAEGLEKSSLLNKPWCKAHARVFGSRSLRWHCVPPGLWSCAEAAILRPFLEISNSKQALEIYVFGHKWEQIEARESISGVLLNTVTEVDMHR